MKLSENQQSVKNKIEKLSPFFGIDPAWAAAVAMTESSLGEKQKSPTGCRGVFQMSGIAMKDLLQEMEKRDDDMIDIACGVAFLYLLFRRHKTIEAATGKFCDPKDRGFYVERVLKYMDELKKGELK
jgi:membrane-bound lytic murein transglycosylase MltF